MLVSDPNVFLAGYRHSSTSYWHRNMASNIACYLVNYFTLTLPAACPNVGCKSGCWCSSHPIHQSATPTMTVSSSAVSDSIKTAGCSKRRSDFPAGWIGVAVENYFIAAVEKELAWQRSNHNHIFWWCCFIFCDKNGDPESVEVIVSDKWNEMKADETTKSGCMCRETRICL